MWDALARSRLWAWRRQLRLRTGITILCYHGVVESIRDATVERNFHTLSVFRSETHLLQGLRTISLAELANELTDRRRRLEPAVAITFDDGQANNLLAAEILAEARLPWSTFICTGVMGTQRPIFPVELCLLLLHGQADRVEAVDRWWPLGSRAQREAARQILAPTVKAMPSGERQQTLEDLRRQFPAGETERVLKMFPSCKALSWNDVRQLGDAGVDIGSHGVHHENHHAKQPQRIRKHELADSKRQIEETLGRPCRFFAFPNGDYNALSAEEVRKAGYELSFTVEAGTVQPDADPFLLPRLDAAKDVDSFTRELLGEKSVDGGGI